MLIPFSVWYAAIDNPEGLQNLGYVKARSPADAAHRFNVHPDSIAVGVRAVAVEAQVPSWEAVKLARSLRPAARNRQARALLLAARYSRPVSFL